MTANRTLKVGLVLDDGLDKPDGVQQYILDVGKWLQKQGHDVHYLVGQTKRQDIENVHSLSRNIWVRSNGNAMSIPLPTSRRKLRRFLTTEQFDVLHVQTPYSPFMGEQLIMLAGPGTAIIGTFHILPNAWYISIGNTLLGLLCHLSLKRFDAMLSVSTAAQKFALGTFRVKSEVLPNVVDYGRFNAAAPFAEYDDKVITILFLGRLVPRKGCRLLLQALSQLKSRQDLPAFRVLICGKGPEGPKLEQYVADHGLQDTVSFLGFVDEKDKPRYYASADITVFPSSGGESFGIVLIEAMASGRSVVLAGDNPGYHSVMAPRPELLFNPKDADSLTEKLAYYLKNEAERQAMQAWAADYSKQFDVNVVGAKLLDAYKKALLKRRGA